MNILITNKYGARAISCEKHFAERRACFATDVATRPIAEDQTEIKDGYMADLGCYLCRQEADRAALPGLVRAALLDPKLSHTRQRSWCGASIIYVYHRDSTSPSGVMLAVGIDEEQFNVIYNELRAAGLISSNKSPLSPTEGMGR